MKPIGDLIAEFTKALGIKPCKPCEERRRRLNEAQARMFGSRRPNGNTKGQG